MLPDILVSLECQLVAPPDTTVAPPDTTVAPPDTTGAPPVCPVAPPGAKVKTLPVDLTTGTDTYTDCLSNSLGLRSRQPRTVIMQKT